LRERLRAYERYEEKKYSSPFNKQALAEFDLSEKAGVTLYTLISAQSPMLRAELAQRNGISVALAFYYINKIRKVFKSHNITIKNIRNEGYFITPEDKESILHLLRGGHERG
jgi:transcriptional antiterminator